MLAPLAAISEQLLREGNSACRSTGIKRLSLIAGLGIAVLLITVLIPLTRDWQLLRVQEPTIAIAFPMTSRQWLRDLWGRTAPGIPGVRHRKLVKSACIRTLASPFTPATRTCLQPAKLRTSIQPRGARQSTQRATAAEQVILVGDIGGTNSRLILYRVSETAEIIRNQLAPGEIMYENKYLNAKYSSFSDVVETFFMEAGCELLPMRPGCETPCVAVLGVAGVVTANQARLTNIDWVIDGYALERELNIPSVEVLNDFVVQGYGTLTLGSDDIIPFHDVPPMPGAPIVCIGAGTGLGEAFLVPGPGGQYRCYPSEGGHKEWAPRGEGSDDTQIELLKYLKVKFSEWNRVSTERVVSGTGICNIYDFLCYRSPHKRNKTVHSNFLASRKDASIITNYARTPGSIGEQTLNIFAACYGAEAGTLAVQFMPFGGLYLTGGVTLKVLDFLLKDGIFMEAYRDKGRVKSMLDQVPVYVVKNEDMGQRGAHLRAVMLLKEFLAGTQVKLPAAQWHLSKENLVPPRGWKAPPAGD